jgi:hypothetical protein
VVEAGWAKAGREVMLWFAETTKCPPAAKVVRLIRLTVEGGGADKVGISLSVSPTMHFQIEEGSANSDAAETAHTRSNILHDSWS